eukprot:2289902-Rhodomonas_salina.7
MVIVVVDDDVNVRIGRRGCIPGLPRSGLALACLPLVEARSPTPRPQNQMRENRGYQRRDSDCTRKELVGCGEGSGIECERRSYRHGRPHDDRIVMIWMSLIRVT